MGIKMFKKQQEPIVDFKCSIRELIVKHCNFYNGICISKGTMCDFAENGSFECVHFLNHVLPNLLKNGEYFNNKYNKNYELPKTDGKQIVFLDLETSGRSCKDDSIIEIGIIKFGAKKTEIGDLYYLISPENYLDERITKITGITNKDLEGTIKIQEAIDSIISFIGKDSIIIGHNIKFDLAFLKETLRKTNCKQINNTIIDTFELAIYLFPFENCHLSNIAKKLNILMIDNENKKIHNFPNRIERGFHSALYDAHITSKIFFELEKMYYDKKKTEIYY